jgi:sugar phosphate isomerase/epimerase
MTLYVSSGAFRSRHVPDIVTMAEELGLTHIELSSGCDSVADPAGLLKILQASPLVFSVHNYFPPPPVPFVLNLGALDPQTLAASRDHVRRCIELTNALGGTYYSVHSAFALNLSPQILGRPQAQSELARRSGSVDRDAVRAIFVESLRLLCGEAAAKGIALLVENNVVSPLQAGGDRSDLPLMADADEIESVFNEVAAPNLGLLLDVAHARVSANALGFDAVRLVERLACHIRLVHISNDDGVEDRNLPVREDSWFWPSISTLADRDIVIEAYRLDGKEIVAQRDLTARMLGIR